MTDLQSQHTRAIIEDDGDFDRFDDLLHVAENEKEDAKYALLSHIAEHHCEPACGKSVGTEA
jgi:hypothetical protein